MLTALSVQNLVVVREVEIEFAAGLTVLTGETGAGKSILIEALSLALGERADSQMIRDGADRAVVSATFDVGGHAPALAFLREHALDDGADCIVRRVINRDGRSRAFLNASPVTVAMLRELAGLLVDIHAQHASQRLLGREFQRYLLDAYGDLEDSCTAVRAAYEAWKEAAEALARLSADGADRARLDLLRYQAEELTNATLDRDELAGIEGEYKKLANASSYLEHCATLRQILDNTDGGTLDSLGIALHEARALASGVPEARNLCTALEQASAAAGDALHELESVESHLETDPESLRRLDRRLDELHKLARKHQVGLTELADLYERLNAELERFDRRDGDAERLAERCATTRASYDQAASALSAARKSTAERMNLDISQRLHELGMPHARFAVELDDASERKPHASGRDRVSFMVATNPEQTPGPVNKVASGGELSRVTLAIQAATARHTGVAVAVYDEVDTGIGGNTANIVGRSLRDVARHAQVICITHSPQVASAGDHHVLVDKQVVDGKSETSLRTLSTKLREKEIARMLGAAEATRSSIAHARDLLTSAQD